MSLRFVRKHLTFALAWPPVFYCCLFAVARAENEGQDDLDQATEKKLSAESMDDLAKVADLRKRLEKRPRSIQHPVRQQFAHRHVAGTCQRDGQKRRQAPIRKVGNNSVCWPSAI